MNKAQHHPRYRRLPDLLREIREEAGMTQRQVGAKLKKPQSWIYNCEQALRRVDLAEFVDWCKSCGLDPFEGLRRFLKS